MKLSKQIPEFRLIKVDPFDARHSMVRCTTPGIGVSIAGRRGGAVADFWKDSFGNMAVRVSCSGEPSVQFVATMKNGEPCYDGKNLEDFTWYMIEVLLGWFTDGDKGCAHKVGMEFTDAFQHGSNRLESKFDKEYLWENDASLVPMTYERNKRL